jgi:hypothetical protein
VNFINVTSLQLGMSEQSQQQAFPQVMEGKGAFHALSIPGWDPKHPWLGSKAAEAMFGF